MANALGLLGRQLGDIWTHFGINQKVSVLTAVIMVVGVMGGVMYWTSRPSYGLLKSNMALEDASKAREKLLEERIKVELRDGGRSIYVPTKDVYRGRLLVASAGLFKSADSNVGFELFEQPKFGLTDFAQKVNYQRALEGELERTISSMDGVESVRITLVMPSDKLFATEAEKKASASIMLSLAGGASMSLAQVRSIKQFVGGAVPGLSASQITIIDHLGNMLMQPSDTGADSMGAASDQLEMQDKVELQLTKKAQTMLDQAMGAGRSIVRISTQMDFSKIEKSSEKYDNEGKVIVSEKILSESTSSPGSGSGGAVGVVANVSVRNPQTVSVEQNKTKKDDIVNEYKVPVDLERMSESGGRIKGISVAVCVAKGAAERKPEELKRIEDMVKSAVGLVVSGDRKDEISVVEMEFPAAAVAAKPTMMQSLPFSIRSAVNGVVAFLTLIAVLIASKRVMAKLSVQHEEVGTSVASMSANYPSVGSYGMPGGKAIAGSAGASDEDVGLHVSRLAEQNPNAIAAWITSVSKNPR